MAVKESRTFVPPPGHSIRFFQKFDPTAPYSTRQGDSFIVWHKEIDNIYLPPFGNIFDDASICMGSNWTGPTGDTPSEKLGSAIAYYMSTESNLDLHPATAPTPLIMWNPETGDHDYSGIENAANFQSVMRTASGHIFEGFFAANSVQI